MRNVARLIERIEDEMTPDERSGENRAVNAEHLRQLVYPKQGQPRPNLARLEQLSEVQHMTPGEYREAWAWTHLLLRGHPQAKTVLLKYLQELRTTNRPGTCWLAFLELNAVNAISATSAREIHWPLPSS